MNTLLKNIKTIEGLLKSDLDGDEREDIYHTLMEMKLEIENQDAQLQEIKKTIQGEVGSLKAVADHIDMSLGDISTLEYIQSDVDNITYHSDEIENEINKINW